MSRVCCYLDKVITRHISGSGDRSSGLADRNLVMQTRCPISVQLLVGLRGRRTEGELEEVDIIIFFQTYFYVFQRV